MCPRGSRPNHNNSIAKEKKLARCKPWNTHTTSCSFTTGIVYFNSLVKFADRTYRLCGIDIIFFIIVECHIIVFIRTAFNTFLLWRINMRFGRRFFLPIFFFLTRITLPVIICISVPPEVSDFHTGK